MVRHQVDSMAIVSVAFLLFMLFSIVQDAQSSRPAQVAVASGSEEMFPAGAQPAVVQNGAVENLPDGSQGTDLNEMDIDALAAPYESYAVTQGPHGFSYGHAAIDLSDGKGAVILSPINGIVTQLFIDDLGNTTLVIENDHYQVIILHGIYTVAVGDAVKLGQPVGQESNQGNTVDALGNSCRGRDCGYHIHLNIYDKIMGVNINPLQLWQ